MTTNVGPQLKEYGLIALGLDPMGQIEATFSNDGRALILQGTFGAGSAAKVEQLLEAAPAVGTIMLSSRGGRLQEAEQVAELVAARRLDTYVDSHCESACTFVFLAGAERAATPNARIGFHRPSFPGLDELGEQMMLRGMRTTYRAAGISEPFLDQIAATPAASMWYPPREELVDNGVINRTALGGEVASSTNEVFDSKASIERAFRALPHVVAMERHFPGTIEKAVNAAWSARRSGAGDEDIMTATRQIIASNMSQILAMTTNERVDEFTALLIDQLRAASAVSYDACAKLLRGELNIATTLPPDLGEREMSWTQRALEGPLNSRSPPDPAELDAAYAAIFELLSEQEFSALIALEAQGADSNPATLCDTSVDLYETALLLPQPERSMVLRDMFMSE